MRMSDFVVRDAILPDLEGDHEGRRDPRDGRESSRRRPVQGGSRPGRHRPRHSKREMLGSTGIGRGVAIPHTKHASVERLLGTMAVSQAGVAFDSLDGEPVFIFVLLISPQDRPGDHLRAPGKRVALSARRRIRYRPSGCHLPGLDLELARRRESSVSLNRPPKAACPWHPFLVRRCGREPTS